MTGLCECGCGEPAPLVQRTCKRTGRVKGQPARFKLGHRSKLGAPPEYVVNPETGCWLWQRAKDRHGYGSLKRDGCNLAHVYFYEEARGPVPPGFELDHLCRVPLCVNPDHLEPVTHAENLRRGAGTRLTWDDVRAIRASSEPLKVLAARYGVSYGTVGNIRSFQSWKEVA